MIRNKSFKAASLAAAIALAMGSTAVMAQTAPAATQLPGMGNAVLGSATAGTVANNAQTITVDGNTVINWGVAVGTINAKQPGGFNIGSDATLNFVSGTSAGNVLNVDRSGKMSQIMGNLNGDANLYVANANGIIVGKTAKISATGALGLIANVTGDASTFTGSAIPHTGTGGGDVTVMKGATLGNTDTTSILLAGGNTVNVDLASLSNTTTVQAGRASADTAFGKDNASAMINLTGDSEGTNVLNLVSAGDITSAGMVTLNGTVTTGSDGMFTNNGELDAGGTDLSKVSLMNKGKLTTTGGGSFGGLTNDGSYVANGDLAVNGVTTGTGDAATVTGGKLVNNGSITVGIDEADGAVTALSVNNHGTITNVKSVSTTGDTEGSSYSINNDGSITSNGDLMIDANYANVASNDDANGSLGFFSNTGTLSVGAGTPGTPDSEPVVAGTPAGSLTIKAANLISMGGSVSVAGKATSAKNTFGGLSFTAGDVINSGAKLWVSGPAAMKANQIALFGSVIATGTTGDVSLMAGDKSDNGYAVRVASGTTTSAEGNLSVIGMAEGDHPNVILQGTLSGNTVDLGSAANPVSDVFSGPTGGIAATGTNPTVAIHFTGAVKTAPYLNDANNFRYNYLPINSSGPLALTLDPVDYMTNGTSNGLSAVNVLVNKDVNLTSGVMASDAGAPDADGTAVTGVNATPNTHLVLQSTGNITTTGAFYWPGYVYLGTIAAGSSAGSWAPGTLGYGTITLGGDFNNVLPGNVNNGGGIHFITQLPLEMNGHNVITNANSFVNFGTDALTNGYKNDSFGNSSQFYGGTQGNGKVVNYGELDDSKFHTAPPVASR